MEKARLQEVAKELNELLGLDPAIDVEAEDAEISAKVCEAVQLLEKGDKLSADSVSTLMELEQVEHLKRAGLVKEAKKAKEAKTPKEPGKPGVIATIISEITAGPKTKEEILTVLGKLFPERDTEAMKSTLTIQLGGRLKKDKGMNILKDDQGRYSLA